METILSSFIVPLCRAKELLMTYVSFFDEASYTYICVRLYKKQNCVLLYVTYKKIKE